MTERNTGPRRREPAWVEWAFRLGAAALVAALIWALLVAFGAAEGLCQ